MKVQPSLVVTRKIAAQTPRAAHDEATIEAFAEQIVAAARMFATNTPAHIPFGLGTAESGRATTAAVFGKTYLRAITGNLDLHGGAKFADPPSSTRFIQELHWDKLIDHPLRTRDNVGADLFPIALMSMSHKVYSVRGIEITNYSEYGAEYDMRELFGFGQPLDRDHVLGFGGAEDDHPGGVAPDLADLAHRRADQLALVSDQQDLIALLDREGRGKPSAALGEVLGQQALAASARAAELVGRGPLAVAFGRDREDDLLSRAQLGDAIGAEADGVGDLFAADGTVIRQYSSAGELVRSLDAREIGAVYGVEVTGDGTVYAAGGAGIAKFRADGTHLATFPSNWGSTTDVAVAPDGSMYVMAWGGREVRKLDPAGALARDQARS